MQFSFDPDVNKIAEKVSDGERLSLDEGVALYRSNDLNAVASENVIKPVGEFLIRSRIRNRNGSGGSANVHDSWRARWMTHGALGFGVQPATRTRRLPNR